MDTHSYSRPDALKVRHLELELEVDFARRVLRGGVTLNFDPARTEELWLDTRDLKILEARHEGGIAAYTLGERDAILGAALRVTIPRGSTQVRIAYETSPEASALEWCAPRETAGKHHPFLYTQSQAIHARSWIPLQDSPGVRVTFAARIRTPDPLTAVMGAEREESQRPGEYAFRMPQPVPSYLIALAAGDLVWRRLGARSGVWAEPSVVEAAEFEFADTEAMIAAAEELYGEYRWGRYDLLVLPPSFPYGGMENPRLTFATPTILAGDRSLVSLVAHELAHSWSGNLVSNATWSDFWLNEGFTVYVERRIVESIYGSERARMEASLARGELEREMEGMDARDQVLHIDLAGRDPDEGCTLVPYEKGALLLTTIEKTVGRPRFDQFLRQYFERFAFQSITTTDFLGYLEQELPDHGVSLTEWIEAPGIPASAPALDREVFTRTDKTLWCTQEWLHFLRHSQVPMAELDREFGFTAARNAEILHQWLVMAVRSGYEPAFGRLEDFLRTVGRRKYIKPLYAELVKSAEGADRARRIYAKARAGYHPIAQSTVDGILSYQ